MWKKQSSKFRAIDLAIVLFCLTGSVISGTVFYQEYTRTLTRLNEEPVGIIVFKKRTAQRKFIDRVVWDTLKKSSPVYNGDTIRTIEFSEAVVTFRDEVTRLTLNENTMLRIFYNEVDGAKIEFSGGQMEVNSGSRSVVITGASSEIKVEGQANLNMIEKGFSLSVLEGEAVFNDERIESGVILAIDSVGERDISPAIAMTSFGSSAQVLGTYGTAVPVVFSWNEFNFSSDTHVIVEAAEDGNFSRIAGTVDVSGARSTVIFLENGNYRWRAYPAEGGSRQPVNAMYPSGTLEVIPAIPVVLLSPAGETEFSGSGEAGVSFFWTSVQGASSYLLEISTNAEMRNPVVSRRVEGTSVTQSSLENGSWYWRISPVFPDWVIGSLPPSAVSKFTLGMTVPVPVIAAAPEPARQPEPEPEPEPPAVELVEQEPTIRPEPARQAEPQPVPQVVEPEPFREPPVIPIISYEAQWSAGINGGSSVAIRNSSVDFHIGREIIQGQEKEVLTLTVNLARGSDYKIAWLQSFDESIIQRMKNGSGIRFKVVGDRGRGWLLDVPTIDAGIDYCWYQAAINTVNGQVVEIDIPYSRLRQPDWGKRVPFISNNISGLQIQRNSNGPSISGTSTIKIFDFEIY